MSEGEKKAALFLDRDGVINEDTDYLHAPDNLKIFEGIGKTLTKVNRLGIPVVVVTNQSGIGRGYYTEADYLEINRMIGEKLKEDGAHIDRFYHCPHHPTGGIGTYLQDSEDRKPKPGMLLKAAGELELDLSGSIMVGDKESDLVAGRAAGTACILVRTGYGREHEERLTKEGRSDLFDAVFDALPDALPWILDRFKKQ